ncbi:hypothetical protein FRC01_001937, partial [Tulasnella sp. 417]
TLKPSLVGLHERYRQVEKAKPTLSSQISTKLEIESFEDANELSEILTRAKFAQRTLERPPRPPLTFIHILNERRHIGATFANVFECLSPVPPSQTLWEPSAFRTSPSILSHAISKLQRSSAQRPSPHTLMARHTAVRPTSRTTGTPPLPVCSPPTPTQRHRHMTAYFALFFSFFVSATASVHQFQRSSTIPTRLLNSRRPLFRGRDPWRRRSRTPQPFLFNATSLAGRLLALLRLVLILSTLSAQPFRVAVATVLPNLACGPRSRQVLPFAHLQNDTPAAPSRTVHKILGSLTSRTTPTVVTTPEFSYDRINLAPTLKGAGTKEDIDDASVIIVGGFTRIPNIESLLKDFFDASWRNNIASFNDAQGTLTGLAILCIINELTTAVIAYLLDKRTAEMPATANVHVHVQQHLTTLSPPSGTLGGILVAKPSTNRTIEFMVQQYKKTGIDVSNDNRTLGKLNSASRHLAAAFGALPTASGLLAAVLGLLATVSGPSSPLNVSPPPLDVSPPPLNFSPLPRDLLLPPPATANVDVQQHLTTPLPPSSTGHTPISTAVPDLYPQSTLQKLTAEPCHNRIARFNNTSEGM